MFELLWMRQLSLVLGSTIEAAALVTGTFLAFLGMGAALGERWSRSQSPLRTYAWIELGVACSGLLVSLYLPQSGSWVAALGAKLPPGPLLSLLRLLVCCVSLGLPCLFMGASLPVLCAYLSQHWGHEFARGLGGLYALNTLGGATGVLVCDGLLISSIGLWQTSWVAAFLDLAVAAVALGLASWGSASAATTTHRIVAEPGSPPVYATRSLLLVAWGLGLSGTLLQLVWTRCLMVFQGSDHWAYSGCLATYLVCLALGGAVVARWPRSYDSGRGLPKLLLLAALLSTLSLATLPWARALPAWLANPLQIAPTGILLGLAFPLLAEQCHRQIRRAAASAGWVLAANTLGSLSGSLLAAFVALPLGGLQGTLLLGSLWLAVLGFFLAPRPSSALASLALAFGIWVAVPRDYVFRLFLSVPPAQILYRGEDSYGALALVEQPQEVGEPTLELIVDGFNMMSSGLPTRRYATALAALPALWKEQAPDILVICLGLGHTTETALELPGTRRVDCVELSPHVPRALAHHPRGQRLLANPKLQLHLGDGRHFLLTTDRLFDVITAEPPPPVRAGAVHLYTRDYYQLCARRLKPGGLVSQWLPIFQIPREHTRAMIAAFLEVFPSAYLVEGAGPQLLLVGGREPWQVGEDSLRTRVQEAKSALLATGWDAAELQLGSILLGPSELRQYVGKAPALSDDWPVLEYQRKRWDPDYTGLMFASPPASLPLAASESAVSPRLEKARRHLRGLRRYLFEPVVANDASSSLRASGLLERHLWVRSFLREYPNNQYLQAACEATPELLQQRVNRPQDWAAAGRAFFFLGQNTQARVMLREVSDEGPLDLLLLRWWVDWELGDRAQLEQQARRLDPRLSPADRDLLRRALLQAEGAGASSNDSIR